MVSGGGGDEMRWQAAMEMQCVDAVCMVGPGEGSREVGVAMGAVQSVSARRRRGGSPVRFGEFTMRKGR